MAPLNRGALKSYLYKRNKNIISDFVPPTNDRYMGPLTGTP